jgi:hypothetical protein
LQDLSINRNVTLNPKLKKLGVGILTWFSWLRIRRSSGTLFARYWTFRLRPSTSQEDLC